MSTKTKQTGLNLDATPKRGVWRIDLTNATISEKQRVFNMLGMACRSNAVGVEQLHNGAKWIDCPLPTEREKALSRVVSRTQGSVIESNYRYAKRKVNKHKKAVNKHGQQFRMG